MQRVPVGLYTLLPNPVPMEMQLAAGNPGAKLFKSDEWQNRYALLF